MSTAEVVDGPSQAPPESGRAPVRQGLAEKWGYCDHFWSAEELVSMLSQAWGELLYALQRAARIILGCCVLHNICLVRNDSWELNEESTKAGFAIQKELITQYFTHIYSHIGIQYMVF